MYEVERKCQCRCEHGVIADTATISAMDMEKAIEEVTDVDSDAFQRLNYEPPTLTYTVRPLPDGMMSREGETQTGRTP